MTNREIIKIAMQQSAKDIGCQADDFIRDKNIISLFKLGKNAKKYYKQPIMCNFISYGSNIVAATTEEIFDIVKEYIERFDFYSCFETPNIYWINKRLFKFGYKVCFMAKYYLPDINKIAELKCLYETRVLEQKDFKDLYLPEWRNSLCVERKHLDILGVGTYDDNKLIGLAACSADCEKMWQIGVDVLSEYRQKGIGSALTNKLIREILSRDKVPFYCAAWSNIRSARNAIKSGFRPVWVEMTVKPTNFVDQML